MCAQAWCFAATGTGAEDAAGGARGGSTEGAAGGACSGDNLFTRM